jgi:uncharacterized membrane protein/ribosomal protein L40E
MNYCPKCGAYIPDGDTKCVACGFDTAEKKKEEPRSSYDYGGTAAQAAPEEDSRQESYTGTVVDDEPQYDNRGSYSEPIFDDAVQNRGMAVLCYFGPLFIIPLMTRRNSPFVRYHANQGLVLFLAELLVDFCAVIPVIGSLAAAVGGILIFFAFISGLINALNGRMRPIPVFGSIKILK